MRWRRITLALLVNAVVAAPGLAQPRRRKHHHHPAAIELFAAANLRNWAAYGTPTDATRPSLWFQYPIYAAATPLDLSVLALSVLTAALPHLVPKLQAAPVLPIPLFQSGGIGLALWGRIQ